MQGLYRRAREGLEGHIGGKPVHGPATEDLDECLNRQPLVPQNHPAHVCPSGNGTVFDCVMSPILCQQCARNRFHIMCGFGRPLMCLCHYCQHNRMSIVPAGTAFDQHTRLLGYAVPARVW